MFKKRSPIGQEHRAVLEDVTDNISKAVLSAGDGLSEYTVRNTMLDLAAHAVGAARMHWHAAYHMDKNASRDGTVQTALFGRAYPGGSEHARALSTSHQTQAALLANLACAVCPLQAECGIGGDELVKELDEPSDRRRFVRRVRKDSTRFCETNLRPGRLRKDEN